MASWRQSISISAYLIVLVISTTGNHYLLKVQAANIFSDNMCDTVNSVECPPIGWEEAGCTTKQLQETNFRPFHSTGMCEHTENNLETRSFLSTSNPNPSKATNFLSMKFYNSMYHFQQTYLRRKLNQKEKVLAQTRISGGAEEEVVKDEDSHGTIRQQSSSSNASFLGRLDDIRRRSFNVPKSVLQKNDAVLQRMSSAADVLQQTGSKAIPSALTALSLTYAPERGMSIISLYIFALMGASCGFHLFLHFITIGYALGIGLPLAVALFVYSKHSNLPKATIFQTSLTLAWSVRMLGFLIWREYISWPALHEKVVEIQSRMVIPLTSRLLCWFVYSFFYLSMMSMNWTRLSQGVNAKWGLIGFIGLMLQIGGLTLETVADFQKNKFKSKNRHAWCNIGVWKWSTHPNYLGEGMFWWGCYIGHGFSSISTTLFATIGLAFIMQVLRGSTRSLARKHVEKYGEQPAFFDFQRTHSILGPKPRSRQKIENAEELKTITVISQVNVTETATNTSSATVEPLDPDDDFEGSSSKSRQ